MVSYLVEWGTKLLQGEEEDDPSILKDVVVMSIYENPHKQLGVSLNASPWDIRNAMRTNSIRLLAKTYFNKMDKPVLTYKYSMIAWHLCSKTLNVSKAQELKRILDELPHLFSGTEKDALPILRPVSGGNSATRACGWLQCIFVEAVWSASEGDVHQIYIIRVVYCGRVHFIRKRYSEFEALNSQLAFELLMVPGFPEKSIWFKFGFGDWHQRGESLCAYANRVHASLAARGVYSPRLLKFLGIDVARVHIEEDGRISKMLDSTGAQQGSVWHLVEEGWLKRWRKFVLGRAARRYEPPGPITNELLLVPRDITTTDTLTTTTTKKDDDFDTEKKENDARLDIVVEARASTVPVPKRRLHREYPATIREIKTVAARENRHIFVPGADSSIQIGATDETTTTKAPGETPLMEAAEKLTIGKHYRAVNYNLWVYWKMVHGGGPCISRKYKDITSAPACGTNAEARSRLQRFGRVCVAKNRRLHLYWQHLSKTAPGVREVLFEFEEKRLKKRADDAIAASKSERTKSRLRDAARYTQRSWRAKKQYAFNDDNVRVQKHAQEVFATADGEVEHAAPGAPFGVEEGEAVVKLGGAERYDVRFTDADGPTLPITLKKHSCSELTFVQIVDKPKLGLEGSLQTPHSAGRHPVTLSSSARKAREQLIEDSVLLVVQNYPVSSISHSQAMGRLTAAKWPLMLRFERPLAPKDVLRFSQVVDLELERSHDDDEKTDAQRQQEDDFKLQLMKRLLHMGIDILKYGRKGRPHRTVLYLNETLVFWQIKQANAKKLETPHLSLKYDLTKGMNLYDLKYVRIATVSPVFQSPLNTKADPSRSFSIFAGTSSLSFS